MVYNTQFIGAILEDGTDRLSHNVGNKPQRNILKQRKSNQGRSHAKKSGYLALCEINSIPA